MQSGMRAHWGIGVLKQSQEVMEYVKAIPDWISEVFTKWLDKLLHDLKA